ncbi:MAG: hypothetical protein R3A79_12290 [Nannocystaceae bacterium]
MCARGASVLLSFLLLSACEDHDHDHDHENETISRVSLTFSPTDGGAARTFTFDDPDGDGGVSGAYERIELSAGVTYELTLRFENALVDPPENITEEIEEEAEDHMVFIVGDVVGPASAAAMPLVSQSYADLESDYAGNATGEDLPVGLVHHIDAVAAGEGSLRVLLRHLPPLHGVAQKSGDLPSDLAAGRDLPGSVDVDVTFALVVAPS